MTSNDTRNSDIHCSQVNSQQINTQQTNLLEFQLSSWNSGTPVSLESLFDMMPAEDRELQLDLVYQEICRREDQGEEARLIDYSTRFPALADELPALFEVHTAMKRDFDLEQDPVNEQTPFSKRYSHLRELGTGGLGRVFLALDSQLGRHVAIKKLRPEFSQHRHHNARFLREATLTAKLSHPSIVPIYDLGRDNHDDVYYSMKFIDGKSLDDLTTERISQAFDWRDHKLELRRLISQMIRVCQGLRHAHDRGIIHRDIKPANILIADCGEVLLVDWGVAGHFQTASPSLPMDTIDEQVLEATRDTEGEYVQPKDEASNAGPANSHRSEPATSTGNSSQQRLTVAGMRLGTPAFMSPEQLVAPESATPLSDVYALGATLRFTLLGSVKSTEDYSPMLFGAPRELLAICDQATNSRAGARYSCIRALEEDLQNWLAGEPLLALPEGPVKKIARWCAAHQKLVLSVASACAILFVFAMIFTFQELRIQEVRNLQLEQQAVANKRLYRSAVIAMANAEELDSHAIFREIPFAPDEMDLRQAVHDHFVEVLENSNDRNRPRNHVHLALSATRIANYSEALNHAKTGSSMLAELEPTPETQELIAKAWLLAAELQFRNEDYDGSIRVCEQAVEKIGKQKELKHYELAFQTIHGIALAKQGKYQDALELLGQVSWNGPEFDPTMPGLDENVPAFLDPVMGFQNLKMPGESLAAATNCQMRASLAAMAIHRKRPFSFTDGVFSVVFGPPTGPELSDLRHVLLAPISELMPVYPENFMAMP